MKWKHPLREQRDTFAGEKRLLETRFWINASMLSQEFINWNVPVFFEDRRDGSPNWGPTIESNLYSKTR